MLYHQQRRNTATSGVFVVFPAKRHSPICSFTGEEEVRVRRRKGRVYNAHEAAGEPAP
jgi:hypothetical protein